MAKLTADMKIKLIEKFIHLSSVQKITWKRILNVNYPDSDFEIEPDETESFYVDIDEGRYFLLSNIDPEGIKFILYGTPLQEVIVTELADSNLFHKELLRLHELAYQQNPNIEDMVTKFLNKDF